MTFTKKYLAQNIIFLLHFKEIQKEKKEFHVKVETTHVADVGSIILGPVDSIFLSL